VVRADSTGVSKVLVEGKERRKLDGPKGIALAGDALGGGHQSPSGV
jgi:hypothetical protein